MGVDSLDRIIKQSTDASYKVGQLKELLSMVYETVDEKHINPTLRENIKSQIQ